MQSSMSGKQARVFPVSWQVSLTAYPYAFPAPQHSFFLSGYRPRKERGPPVTAFEQDTLLDLRNTFGQAFLQGKYCH